MGPHPTEHLSDEARLALAHCGPRLRDAFRTLLELDARLARVVSGTTEPMLGQMRLAWWRDALAMDVSDRPQGDAVLDAIGQSWNGAEPALVALVDGWERMLSEPPLSRDAALGFAEGRARAIAGLHAFSSTDHTSEENLKAAGRVWALADAASHIADDRERQTLVEIARALPRPGPLRAPYRGIAVLGALGVRAVEAGGAPLMEGRGASLVALRAGLLGR